MYVWIALGIIGIISGFLFITFLLASLIDESNSTIAGISFIIFVISAGSIFYGTHKLDSQPYEYESKPKNIEYITALSDNSEINGKINGNRYAVRGYINEVLYYSYMKKLSNGGLKANKIPANDTEVYETTDNFRVETYTKHKEFYGLKEEHDYWKLYVPKGSISNDFSIDLE